MNVKHLLKKLGISTIFIIISNLLIIAFGMFCPAHIVLRYIYVVEIAVMIAIQPLFIRLHLKHPLSTGWEKWVYWSLSESIMIITVYFWGNDVSMIWY